MKARTNETTMLNRNHIYNAIGKEALNLFREIKKCNNKKKKKNFIEICLYDIVQHPTIAALAILLDLSSRTNDR